jgi:hypothetical protein
MAPDQTLGFQEVSRLLNRLFDGDLHAKRVLSLANATLGVIRTASLAVATIGQGLALARGLVTKHAIKQVDRLLSNEGIDIDAALRHWVAYVVGPRPSIKVAMDWTDFDADGQACPCEGARGFAHLHSNVDPSSRPRWIAWNCSIPRLKVIGPGGL